MAGRDWDVRHFESVAMRGLEPLHISMNCRTGEFTHTVGAIKLTEVFPLPLAPMTLRECLVYIYTQGSSHIRNSDGRGQLWLVVGGDPIGSVGGHAVVEMERARGETIKVMCLDPRALIHVG